jgi:hypothetical protein
MNTTATNIPERSSIPKPVMATKRVKARKTMLRMVRS